MSIQLSFKEVPNQAKQEVTLDKVVGEETTSSKYFVSNSFVEKIFDNIRTNTLEFEQRIEAKVEVIGENMQ